MTNSDYKIGVVGVGRMGANIARHLNDEGFSVVTVYDIVKDRAIELSREVGAEATDNLARVTEMADFIITVVTDDNAMLKIFSEETADRPPPSALPFRQPGTSPERPGWALFLAGEMAPVLPGIPAGRPASALGTRCQ